MFKSPKIEMANNGVREGNLISYKDSVKLYWATALPYLKTKYFIRGDESESVFSHKLTECLVFPAQYSSVKVSVCHPD